MKKLPLILLAGFAVAACGEPPTAPLAPEPSNELVDEDDRVDAADVNAWVYGTFAIQVQTQGGLGVLTSGPANFPGKPKDGPGTCDNGLWINSQGKRTSGSMERPHPHCVGIVQGVSVQIILEPISAKHGNPGESDNEYLQFANDRDDGQVKKVGGGRFNDPNTQGDGIIQAYAIDAATLNTTKTRVGILTIDLNQFDAHQTNYFESDCTVGSATAPRCLEWVIQADYEPLPAPNGVGVAQTGVRGFLYWTSASTPYNY